MRRWFRRRRVVPRFYEGRGDRALVACAAFCTQGLERTMQPFPGHVLPCPGPRPGSSVLGGASGEWGCLGQGRSTASAERGRCLTWVCVCARACMCVCTRPCAMTAQKQAGFLLLFNSIRMPPPPGSLPRPPPTLSSALSHSTWSREWALSVPRAVWVCRGRCPGKLARCWRPSKPPVKGRACTFHR